jgi:hypothetical protein
MPTASIKSDVHGMRPGATGRDREMTPERSSQRARDQKRPATRELAHDASVDRAHRVLGADQTAELASRVLLRWSSPTAHNKENQMLNATSLAFATASSFDSIDGCLLASVIGGQGQQQPARPQQQQPAQPQPNFMQRWGRNMQTGGEYAMAAGAVGTAVPVLGETGIPEGVAAGGGASWLLGKGIEGVGSLFNH